MKITIWTLTTSLSDGDNTTTFASKAAIDEAFKQNVTSVWSAWSEKAMPEDPREAYDVLVNTPGFNDYLQLDEHEVEVPFPDYCHEIEAALCSWEWMNEKPQLEKYDELWDGYGSPGMRMASVQAGKIVLTVYDLMEAQGFDFTSAYDFEFVPAVLEQLDWPTLLDNNQYGKRDYRPDPAPLLAGVKAKHPDYFSDVWLATAKATGKKLWGYEGLTDDHPELIDRSQDPKQWVKELGEELELIPASTW